MAVRERSDGPRFLWADATGCRWRVGDGGERWRRVPYWVAVGCRRYYVTRPGAASRSCKDKAPIVQYA